MSDTNDEIRHDITHWSDTKLKQWYIDSLMRFEVADCSLAEANSEVILLIMKALGTLVATTTSMDSHDAGHYLKEIIDSARRQMEKREAIKRRKAQSSP